MSDHVHHNADDRRERMLGSLLHSLDARRRRRRAVNAVGIAACLMMLVQLSRLGGSGVGPLHHAVGEGYRVAPVSAYAVQRVATVNPKIAVVVRDTPTSLVQFIDDEQLLASLNENSDCYGLLRRGARVALLDRCAK